MAPSQNRSRTTRESSEDEVRVRETTDWVADYGEDFLSQHISDYVPSDTIPTTAAPPVSTANDNGNTTRDAPTPPASTTIIKNDGRGNRSNHSTQDYTWQEEVALLSMTYPIGATKQLAQHNAWLTTNGYSYQRAGKAVWQHVKKLQKEAADTAVLTQEQKSWKQIQADRRKAAKEGAKGNDTQG